MSTAYRPADLEAARAEVERLRAAGADALALKRAEAKARQIELLLMGNGLMPWRAIPRT